jgi:hypothetical protein
VPIDQPDPEDIPERLPGTTDEAVSGDRLPEAPLTRAGSFARTERTLAHRTIVDASYRQHAIDEGCARVEKLERETVTPATRRIEAEDPDRRLVGLEHRLKERYRIDEKVAHDVRKKGLSADQAFADMKDAILSSTRESTVGGARAAAASCSKSNFIPRPASRPSRRRTLLTNGCGRCRTIPKRCANCAPTSGK